MTTITTTVKLNVAVSLLLNLFSACLLLQETQFNVGGVGKKGHTLNNLLSVQLLVEYL